MIYMKKLFTSESVTEGHPDKLCDYISDSILDSYLEKDEQARVACETVAGKDTIFITGEISSKANVDIEQVARETIKEIGYFGKGIDIDYKTCKIIINVSKQSPDIAQGVDKSLETKEGQDIESEGAGDQGIMFGFATDETEELMPLPISLAHKLSKKLTEVRKNKEIDYLGPDGKVQVTVEYEDDKPIRVDTIVVSSQHKEEITQEQLKQDIKEKVINAVVPKELLDENTKYFINPTGRFVIGGPFGDSGLTGRKIIVDTYGGYSRHGGGAFSGKDPTKVDRSAAYMARHIAKNVVANKLAKKCEIQLAYSIGVAKPVSVYVDTYSTNTIPEEEIVKLIINKFDLSPRGIINYLDLQKPIYKKTTNYGHFGKADLSWEKIIKL
ncbi:MAG: methionine adenosyltransferase [Clostridia bacterium]|nr:methionine adenosyltransferase [Clostridia bacterium]